MLFPEREMNKERTRTLQQKNAHSLEREKTFFGSNGGLGSLQCFALFDQSLFRFANLQKNG
jgi:hypothetical protein